MQLAAYYIFDSELGIENQTINFGGKYFYELKENAERKLIIQRTPNPKYISNFYDKSEKLTLISAIVGRNGAGKTRLLIDIIECISGARRSSNILVFQEGEKVLLFFGNIDKERGIGLNATRRSLSLLTPSPTRKKNNKENISL